ncbi:hypothetical protein G5S_0535 [Chlamydia pecorum E58]|uniref:Uncharacterized protein n=1 Tax=Chlamydia pecorum (strain ATCC VR-628 / DSM 29919 / E58) TaxID=331635 RepID=A0AA34RD57_CHLPE|nr:hypothetical protein G5S_0535 [Chlamydia pecorum E58]
MIPENIVPHKIRRNRNLIKSISVSSKNTENDLKKILLL